MALPPREWKDKDPPPPWDGEQPTQRWRTVRRSVVLWSEDTDVPKGRQGVRFYRQLSGKAAMLAESLPDEKLKGDTSLQNILEFFDRLYEGHMRIAKEIDFETAVYAGARVPTSENFLQYVLRKKQELFRYEQQMDPNDTLGDHTKGKILLKFSKMDTNQTSRVQTWLKGDRSYQKVEEALIRLDTDLDPTTAAGAKVYWQEPGSLEEESWDGPSVYYDHEWPHDEGATELEYYDEDFLGEEYDQGEDSDVEGVYWIDPVLLQSALEEPQLEDTFATFAQVKHQKNQYRLSRGFYSTEKGKGKGKGKGKQNYTGYPSKGSGFGFGKNKSHGKGGKASGKSDKSNSSSSVDWSQHMHRRWDRDHRRKAKQFVRTTKDQMYARVKCWKCGGIGHIAARCTQGNASQGQTGAIRQFYMSGDLESATHFQFDFVESDLSPSTFWLCLTNWTRPLSATPMGVIDTGAINAVCGGATYLAIDAALQQHGLGTLPIPSPKKLGGVGGARKVLAAAEIPLGIGGRSGIVSTAICEGDIPFLVPLPLLAALRVLVDTSAKRLVWPDGTTTQLTTLPSGHDAVSLVDGIDNFVSCSRAREFQRCALHDEVPCRVRDALAQVPTEQKPKVKSVQFAIEPSPELERTSNEPEDRSMCIAKLGVNLGTNGSSTSHQGGTACASLSEGHHDCGSGLHQSVETHGVMGVLGISPGSSQGNACQLGVMEPGTTSAPTGGSRHSIESSGSQPRRDLVEGASSQWQSTGTSQILAKSGSVQSPGRILPERECKRPLVLVQAMCGTMASGSKG
eukprot:6485409-Amphidinium_carterae.1